MTPACTRSLKIVSSVFVGLAALLFASPAFANIWTVTNTSDSGAGSLREAIASAVNGDLISRHHRLESIDVRSQRDRRRTGSLRSGD